MFKNSRQNLSGSRSASPSLSGKAVNAGPFAGLQPVLRIERAGRGGKTVTVIERLPARMNLLEELARTLKSRCGSGGTFGTGERGGFIELQGDKREMVKKIFEEKGVSCRGQI